MGGEGGKQTLQVIYVMRNDLPGSGTAEKWVVRAQTLQVIYV